MPAGKAENSVEATVPAVAGAFFVLAVVISILQNHYSNRNLTEFQRDLANPQNQPVIPAPAVAAPKSAAPATSTTNLTLMAPVATSNAAPVLPK